MSRGVIWCNVSDELAASIFRAYEFKVETVGFFRGIATYEITRGHWYSQNIVNQYTFIKKEGRHVAYIYEDVFNNIFLPFTSVHRRYVRHVYGNMF
jgi:hypothetical protein